MHGRNTNTSNSGSSNGGGGGGGAMRKGPWVAEEDEILLDYVRRHGPRDWSSIRSKGLLPRTGKSCRLRWVNKLKPDLKTGCKFSAEEERIVIDLQGRFGNKWARIATYLPGRTDNDVKNFWSTRQKRLARLLQTPLQPNSKSSKSQGKLAVPNHAPTFEVASLDLIPFGEESSSGQCSQTDFMHNPDAREMVQMAPHLENHHQGLLFNMDPTLPLLEASVDQEVLLPQLHFDHLPNPEFDFPLLEAPNHLPGYTDIGFPDELACCQEASRCAQMIPESLPFFSLGAGKHTFKREEHSQTPDSFFDDFPTDMFDCLEQPPPQPPSSSASW